MVRQTFEAQKMQPLEGDYVKLVTQACEFIYIYKSLFKHVLLCTV